MRERLSTLGTMVRLSWRADAARSVGALVMSSALSLKIPSWAEAPNAPA